MKIHENLEKIVIDLIAGRISINNALTYYNEVTLKEAYLYIKRKELMDVRKNKLNKLNLIN